MPAFAKYNIELHQGIRFANGFQFFSDDAGSQSLDLTGWTFSAQIRTNGGQLVIALDCVASTPTDGLVAVTKPSAGVVLAADIDPIETFRWDLIGTDSSGDKYLLVEGFANIEETVTA